MKISRFMALCGVSYVAFASAGFAQEVYELDMINVSLVDEGQENVEATGGAVISEEDIEALSPQNVSELFARESAVSVAGGAGPAKRIYVFGMEQSNLAVTIDGAPQAGTSWHHTGSSVFDPAFLKSVEVEAGAAAADSGFAAAAGAVSYETVSAYDLLDEGDNIGGRASLSYGDNGQGVAGSLAGFGAYNGFDWLFMVSKQDGDNYETGDGEEVLGSAPAAGGILAKVGYEFDTHRIELNYAHDEDKEDRTIKMNLDLSTDDTLYPMEVTRDTISLRYTTTAPTDVWDPEVFLYVSENDYWRPNYVTSGFNGDMDLQEDQFGGKIQNVFTLDAGSITAGVDFNEHDYSVDAYGDNGAGVRNLSTTQLGAYAQARLEFGRFDISTGARYDFHRFEDWNGERFSDSGGSANATVSYEVVDRVELFAGGSETWLGYNVGEYGFLHARDDPYYTDPDFETAKSRNVKIGLNANFGAFQGGVTYFKTRIEGLSNYVYGGSLENAEPYESEGYTLNAAYSWGTGRVGMNYTNVDVSYDGEDIDPGNSVFTPVGDTAALYVDQDFAEYNLKVGGTVEWAGSIDYTDSFEPQDAYTVVNAYAEWQPQSLSGTTLRLGVDNLFDETYYERSSYGNGTKATAIYAPGRTISLTATLDF
ncbi:TonB-dependent receptor domain-containing protein [Celeribacter halophilus]|uniref:Hemoglobin/transferrin/lactoferrin receptor protein n=1 Tax=Celeribacter halophilus TaxID=576117 RepID=A0A1I3VM80_9RHOB|nr:TonB-dependent receptor [Celeribacter halophilus]PZX09436.1 hemoglobin/transferrin/lactoferrin receptor protein [Celeribacter halophilus]SFJ96189.1 hemoglobin/transferrin/lactoferrin receptor protein [Celeribacter halophilus]